MSKVKRTDFLCLSAMLRAKEAKMLTRDKMEHMLAEPGFAEAARVAAECGYEDMSGMDTAEINAALARRQALEIADVYEMSPSKAVVDMFRLKYEYHNAKTLVKSGGASRQLLSECGRSGVGDLIKTYETGENTELPAALAGAMEEAKKTLARTGDPQLADFILDRAYFAEMTSLAAATGSAVLEGYVQTLIDSANIRSAVRTLAMNGKSGKLALAVIPGGSVDAETILRAAESRDTLAQLCANTAFAEAMDTKDMTDFELRADNAINRYLSDIGRIDFGPEVVAEYLAAVENEIMAIRIILTGKRMGIEPKLLRERLREIYV